MRPKENTTVNSARACNAAVGSQVGPRRLLAAQVLLVILIGACFGCWKVQFAPDTASYIATGQMPMRDALTSPRTLGYPLVLNLVRRVSPDYSAIPWVHLAMLCGGLFVFDVGARRFGASPWDAFAAASAILYAALPWRTPVAFVLTDFPAMIMAVVAIGCLLWLVAAPWRADVWIGLLMAVAAAYHLRPAYLFLVPLVPCLGLLLLSVRVRALGGRLTWRGFLATLLAVCFLPWVIYCGVRLATV